jgi:uncharacterized membrane protein YedE/YeeE
MTFANFTPVASLLGGVLIGLGASAVLVGCGRIAGISNILSSALSPAKGEDGAWRLLFLLGLIVGGAGLALFAPSAVGAPIMGSLPRAVAAAVLVGVGVELGAGCTSGHGVCGIGRLSPRSIIATITFIATGMLTVLTLHFAGWS